MKLAHAQFLKDMKTHPSYYTPNIRGRTQKMYDRNNYRDCPTIEQFNFEMQSNV